LSFSLHLPVGLLETLLPYLLLKIEVYAVTNFCRQQVVGLGYLLAEGSDIEAEVDKYLMDNASSLSSQCPSTH